MINIPEKLEKLLNGGAECNDIGMGFSALHVYYMMIPDSRLELSSDAANGSDVVRPDSFHYYHVSGLTLSNHARK